jgi:hypothetical protein
LVSGARRVLSGAVVVGAISVGVGAVVGGSGSAAGSVAQPPAGLARMSADGVSGSWHPITMGIEVDLSNSGSTTLLYDRGSAPLPAGASFADASQDGKACQVSGNSWHCGPFSVQPGQSFTITLHGSYSISAGAGALTMFASSDGINDSGPFTIPAAPPTPVTPPVAKNCTCVALSVSMKPRDVYTSAAQLVPEGDGLARLGGLVSWTMSCSAGTGGCGGSITLLPPRTADFKFKLFEPVAFIPKAGPYKGKTLYKKGKPMPLTFNCKGPCNATTTGKFFLQVDSASDLLPANRAGKTAVIRFQIDCSGTKTQELRFWFNANGSLNRAKSTLTK